MGIFFLRKSTHMALQSRFPEFLSQFGFPQRPQTGILIQVVYGDGDPRKLIREGKRPIKGKFSSRMLSWATVQSLIPLRASVVYTSQNYPIQKVRNLVSLSIHSHQPLLESGNSSPSWPAMWAEQVPAAAESGKLQVVAAGSLASELNLVHVR